MGTSNKVTEGSVAAKYSAKMVGKIRYPMIEAASNEAEPNHFRLPKNLAMTKSEDINAAAKASAIHDEILGRLWVNCIGRRDGKIAADEMTDGISYEAMKNESIVRNELHAEHHTRLGIWDCGF